jgi:hypothetical protein
MEPQPLPLLCTALTMTGDRFVLVEPGDQAHSAHEQWLQRAFPIASWGRIDWKRVPDRECYRWSDRSEASGLFTRVTRNLNRDSNVSVMWTDAMKPVLLLELATVARHLMRILDVDWDCWIFDREEGWCIESYHEGELCVGRSPFS